jgi:hypothetical protein
MVGPGAPGEPLLGAARGARRPRARRRSAGRRLHLPAQRGRHRESALPGAGHPLGAADSSRLAGGRSRDAPAGRGQRRSLRTFLEPCRPARSALSVRHAARSAPGGLGRAVELPPGSNGPCPRRRGAPPLCHRRRLRLPPRSPGDPLRVRRLGAGRSEPRPCGRENVAVIARPPVARRSSQLCLGARRAGDSDHAVAGCGGVRNCGDRLRSGGLGPHPRPLSHPHSHPPGRGAPPPKTRTKGTARTARTKTRRARGWGFPLSRAAGVRVGEGARE